MRPSDHIDKIFTQTNIETNMDTDNIVLDDAVRAMSKSKQKTPVYNKPLTWRIIMKSKITKFAAAVVVFIAVLIGINMLNGTPAWAETVQKLELSYNQYYNGLLEAMEQNDLKKAAYNADALSEFWQGIHLLAEAKMNSSTEVTAEDSLNMMKRIFGKTVYNNVDKSVFQTDTNQLLNWFDHIQDPAWMYECIHISKQMEEYAEEIRDGERHPEQGVAYAKHCLPAFTAYCDWFNQLPFDNPKEPMSADVTLAAIKRDLEIVRQEFTALEIRSVDRFAKRCIQQAEINTQKLNENLISPQSANQWELALKLSRKSKELSDLITYLTIASGDITLRNKIHNPEAINRILNSKFNNNDSFAEYFVEQVDQALGFCDQIGNESEQTP